jgi:HSP90 family molecular chaperone
LVCWVSDGSGTFDITEIPENEATFERGTRIVIHLKPEYSHYLDETALKSIV